MDTATQLNLKITKEKYLLINNHVTIKKRDGQNLLRTRIRKEMHIRYNKITNKFKWTKYFKITKKKKTGRWYRHGRKHNNRQAMIGKRKSSSREDEKKEQTKKRD